ncbi:MAG: hypothetical protein KJP04_02465, partial [Arenicella sp.]|nr:hypothetical protein [Arenicella sp.]
MFKFNWLAAVFAAVLVIPVLFTVEVLTDSAEAYAQKKEKPQRKTKRVESIPQALIKEFEKLSEAFDQEDYARADSILNKLQAKEDLNNISKAYIHNYRGNIHFSRD